MTTLEAYMAIGVALVVQMLVRVPASRPRELWDVGALVGIVVLWPVILVTEIVYWWRNRPVDEPPETGGEG